MKAFALILTLLLPVADEVQTIDPECDDKKCTLTVEQMKMVTNFQAAALALIREQQKEIREMKKSCGARDA